MNVGNNGFSWSSATSGINGLDLNFNSQNLNTSNSDNRAHGFQLRCLFEHLSRHPDFFFSPNCVSLQDFICF
ncbi:hypothetical protein [uncultured Rikenella sp.]|uniref:hypothetical protein n=1 Tax=uncultured Rikenella sp. TaxID=368003 RepID=UPI00272C8C5D|nr:hypothetical protein [uncultured Rikenella sp.]